MVLGSVLAHVDGIALLNICQLTDFKQSLSLHLFLLSLALQRETSLNLFRYYCLEFLPVRGADRNLKSDWTVATFLPPDWLIGAPLQAWFGLACSSTVGESVHAIVRYSACRLEFLSRRVHVSTYKRARKTRAAADSCLLRT